MQTLPDFFAYAQNTLLPSLTPAQNVEAIGTFVFDGGNNVQVPAPLEVKGAALEFTQGSLRYSPPAVHTIGANPVVGLYFVPASFKGKILTSDPEYYLNVAILDITYAFTNIPDTTFPLPDSPQFWVQYVGKGKSSIWVDYRSTFIFYLEGAGPDDCWLQLARAVGEDRRYPQFDCTVKLTATIS